MTFPRDRQSRLASQVGVVRLETTQSGFEALADGLQVAGVEAERVRREAAARWRVGFESDMRVVATELAEKHRNDPEGFRNAWSAEMKRAQAAPGFVRNDAALILNSIGDGAYRSILAAKADNDHRLAVQSGAENSDALRTSYMNLARAGKENTPEGQALLARYQQSLLDLKQLGAINDDGIKHRLDSVADDVAATRLSDIAFEAYMKAGGGSAGVAAARKVMDRVNTDPKLDKVSRDALALSRQRLADRIRERRSAVAAANAQLAGEYRKWATDRLNGRRRSDQNELLAELKKRNPTLYKKALEVKAQADKVDAETARPTRELIERFNQLSRKALTAGISASERDELAVVTTALKRNAARMNADRVQFIHDRHPALKAQYEEAKKDPTKMAAYHSAVHAVQKKEGVPRSDRDLIPTTEAKFHVEQINSLSGSEKVGYVAQLRQQFGSAFPAVFKQLVDNKLDPATEVWSGIPNAHHQTAIVEALATGEKKIKELVEPDKVREVNKEVFRVSVDFVAAYSQLGAGTKTGQYLDVVRTYALDLVARGRATPAEAVKMAYDRIVGARGSVARIGKSSVFVPRVLSDGTPADINAIRGGIARTMMRQNLDKIEIDPKSIPSRFKGVTPAARVKAAKQHLAANYGFRPTRGGTGGYPTYADGTTVTILKNGEPVDWLLRHTDMQKRGPLDHTNSRIDPNTGNRVPFNAPISRPK